MVNARTTKSTPFGNVDPSHLESLIQEHARHDEMSSEEYLERYRSVLGRSMDQQAKIYLDTLVWVELREVVLGKGKPEGAALLQCLREIVRQRKGLCVSHLYSLLELGQQNEASLRVTADLVQELSEGVALVSPNELLAWECAQFVHSVTGCPAPSPHKRWTKVGFCHQTRLTGLLLPSTVPQLTRNRTLKLVTDHLWSATFDQIFEAFNWDTKSKLRFDIGADLIADLEKIRQSNRANGRTFYSDRVLAFEACVDQQLRPLFEAVLVLYSDSHNSNLLKVIKAARDGFHKNKLGLHLGLSCLLVDLYVQMVTADKPLKSNDYVDWAHAGAALPNCDVFITERYLAHQLTKVLRADKTYGCEVVSGLEAATKLLSERYL